MTEPTPAADPTDSSDLTDSSNPGDGSGPAPVGETCPHCGATLVTGTEDLADTPDHPVDLDEPRAEFEPGRMVSVTFCPNDDCPSRDLGVQE